MIECGMGTNEGGSIKVRFTLKPVTSFISIRLVTEGRRRNKQNAINCHRIDARILKTFRNTLPLLVKSSHSICSSDRCKLFILHKDYAEYRIKKCTGAIILCPLRKLFNEGMIYGASQCLIGIQERCCRTAVGQRGNNADESLMTE